MKKNVLLFFTMIITLFVFCGKAYAAKELTCIYDKGLNSVYKMLVQEADGNISLFYIPTVYQDSIELSANDTHWIRAANYGDEGFEFDFSDTSSFVNGELSSCPNYSTKFMPSMTNVAFSDTNPWFDFKLDYSLLEDLSGNFLPKYINVSKIIAEKNDSDDWTARCVYGNAEGKIYIWFNENRTDYVNMRPSAKETVFSDSFLNDLNDLNYCPSTLYENYTAYCGPDYATAEYHDVYFTSYYGRVQYSMMKPSGIFNYCIGATGSGSMDVMSELPLIRSESEKNYDNNPVSPSTPDDNPDDCESLLGEDLINIVQSVMDIVKIVIPVLLIGLGTFDFAKAVFAGKEEDMVKCRKTFILRIVAAVLVFISPIFINMILTIANSVWSYIYPNTCVH